MVWVFKDQFGSSRPCQCVQIFWINVWCFSTTFTGTPRDSLICVVRAYITISTLQSVMSFYSLVAKNYWLKPAYRLSTSTVGRPAGAPFPGSVKTILIQENMQPEVNGLPMFKTRYRHTFCTVPEYLWSMLAVHRIFFLAWTLLDVCISTLGSPSFCICPCLCNILIINCSSTVNHFPLDFISRASFCFRSENGSQLILCLHLFVKRVRHVEGMVSFRKK